MKRLRRGLRIVERKAETGNPKDYSKVEIFSDTPIGAIALIDDNIIITNGKVLYKNDGV